MGGQPGAKHSCQARLRRICPPFDDLWALRPTGFETRVCCLYPLSTSLPSRQSTIIIVALPSPLTTPPQRVKASLAPCAAAHCRHLRAPSELAPYSPTKGRAAGAPTKGRDADSRCYSFDQLIKNGRAWTMCGPASTLTHTAHSYLGSTTILKARAPPDRGGISHKKSNHGIEGQNFHTLLLTLHPLRPLAE
jgi:hypothetical protein